MTNIENLRTAYQAWHDTRGENIDIWISLMSESIVMRSLAEGDTGMEFSLARRGLSEARRYFAELRNQWELISFLADEFFSQGDRIVVFGHGTWRSRATGKNVESPLAHFWRFCGGKATEYFEFHDTVRAFTAAALPS